MRKLGVLVAALAVAACTDTAPTGTENGLSAGLVFAPVLAHHAVQLTSAIEVPACVSASKAIATINVHNEGSIASSAAITNRGHESVRFGHIHHLNAGAQTGPIIWWLTSPIGVDLNLTDPEIRFKQLGAFVANAHFANHDAGLAVLLAHPEEFYVNFHSDACPGGFARAFLTSNTPTLVE